MLVSCILPTRGRREFFKQSLVYFERQTYPELELVVIDDGDAPIEDLIPNDSRYTYRYLGPLAHSVGVKRNVACALASGQIIAHWDDDDWYPPDRIERQLAALVEHDAEIVGVSSFLYADLGSEDLSGYRFTSIGPDGDRWLSALMYLKQVWQQTAHEDRVSGSDTVFLRQIQARRHVMRDENLQLCTMHSRNTSPKCMPGDPQWNKVARGDLEHVAGSDWNVIAALKAKEVHHAKA